ncbi:MAG: hypothetical protein HN919_06605 [Verrucomicrobia bacterium]|jgi:hypothetical protein|nr:hypothetical protein [Verrucomicrobiota bacterium]
MKNVILRSVFLNLIVFLTLSFLWHHQSQGILTVCNETKELILSQLEWQFSKEGDTRDVVEVRDNIVAGERRVDLWDRGGAAIKALSIIFFALLVWQRCFAWAWLVSALLIFVSFCMALFSRVLFIWSLAFYLSPVR